MGCNGSKSDGGEPKSKPNDQPVSNGDAAPANENPATENGTDEAVETITVEEAVQQVKDELDVDEETAKRLVKAINQNDDKEFSKKEAEMFRSKVKEAKDYLMPEFKEKDAENTGMVTLDEAVEIMKAKFPAFSEGQLTKLCKRYDVNDDGKVTYGHVIVFHAMMRARKDYLSEMYNALDADGSGAVSVDELTKALMDQCGLDEKGARCIAEDFDDGDRPDGKITRAEFDRATAAVACSTV